MTSILLSLLLSNGFLSPFPSMLLHKFALKLVFVPSHSYISLPSYSKSSSFAFLNSRQTSLTLSSKASFLLSLILFSMSSSYPFSFFTFVPNFLIFSFLIYLSHLLFLITHSSFFFLIPFFSFHYFLSNHYFLSLFSAVSSTFLLPVLPLHYISVIL